LGLVVVIALAAGLVWLRLSQGPIHLPLAAGAAVQLFNVSSERLRAAVGDVVLTLGGPSEPAGIQFVDVRLSYTSGELLFAIPRLTARFDATDLVQGRLRPISITLIRPEARLERTPEGRFRFGLGPAPESAVPQEPPVGGALQMAAIARILDGLAGDAAPVPELSRLQEIAISDGNLVFENAAIGRRWHTRQADLRVWRAGDGLRARLEIGLAAGKEAGAGAIISAVRPPGAGGATKIEAHFDNLRPEHLAEQIEALEWLRLFDAPLDGELRLTLHPDGRVEGLAGRLAAGTGRILALGEGGQPIDRAELAFAYEAGRERMHVTEFALVAPAAEARLSGFADLLRGPDGEAAGLAMQFEVAGLRAEVPQVFTEPVAFDDGLIVGRLDFRPMRFEVARSHLRAGDLVIEVTGEARAAETGWRTALRAAGRNMTVAQLTRFWPHVAAGNARKWVGKNIRAGTVDAFVAHMRFAGARPEVSLDFTYSGLESRYLKAMTPIVVARGRGSLTLDAFNLSMESGEVRAVEGAPVRLDGSLMRIPDLAAKPAIAEITLRGQGPTASVLTLINEEPLRLTSKLGLVPSSVAGEAQVTAELSFPLIDELELGGVAVEAEATLRALALPFRLPGGHVANVRGDEVALNADPQAMRVSGPITVDGTPLNLEWNENYGRGGDHRDLAIAGTVTPDFLTRLKLDTEYFAGGSAQIQLNLTQTGSPDLAFDLKADLGPARLLVSEFSWEKPPGPGGQLVAQGTFGQDIRVPAFQLETDELKMEGAIEFGPGGRMRSADVDRVRFRGLADVALAARSGPEPSDTLELTVGGRRLDLALFDDGEGDTESEAPGEPGRRPLAVTYSLDELVVTPRITAHPAAGSYRRDAAGKAEASLEGALGGRVPFTAQYVRTPGEPASVTVQSDDAGALLAAAGLFGAAEGGRLELAARLDPAQGVELVGIARIRDVRVLGGGTFGSILEQGGAKEAASAAKTGGLWFDKVRVPFEYREDGVMALGESVAQGNLLAVKVEGTVDQTSNALDLVGVISPAYGLTGALDSIPLLGAILSGGKGEGIVAMTFQVQGTLDQPDFSVNPLSLLAPGFLRNVFSGRTAKPDERFMEQLGRDN
jgi:hypothetical protein